MERSSLLSKHLKPFPTPGCAALHAPTRSFFECCQPLQTLENRSKVLPDRSRSVCPPAATTSFSRDYLAPLSGLEDVDEELWGVLDICSDEELEDIHNILYGNSLLSPLVKSLVADNEPPAVHLRGRTTVMRRIESRFRFLAADSGATLRGHRPSYREALLHVRNRLQVPCPGNLATQDLESEIFLHLLRCQAQAAQGAADSLEIAQGIVRAKQRPAEMLREKWAEAVRSVQLGAPELGESMLKFASALSVSSLRQSALRQVGQQLLLQRARYQVALHAVCKGGAPVLQREATMKAAQAGLTNAAARYGTVSGALSMLGPAVWTWLAADLALKAIGTDHRRIVKTVYTLAQVRLLRTNGFINPT